MAIKKQPVKQPKVVEEVEAVEVIDESIPHTDRSSINPPRPRRRNFMNRRRALENRGRR
jgi:hypothetical protein